MVSRLLRSRARGRSDGSREASQENTATTSGGGGLDYVLELGWPAAAQREQAVQLRTDITEPGLLHIGIWVKLSPSLQAVAKLFWQGRRETRPPDRT